MHAEITVIDSLETKEGFSHCVEVSQRDPHGQHREHRILGVREAKEIYAMIDKGVELDLSETYVRDFSVSQYRRLRNLPKDFLVELTDFNANGAFFDSLDEVDFSFVKFQGAETNFQSAIFGDCPISFYHSVFAAANTLFDNTKFGAGLANFQYSEYSSKTVSFDNAYFKMGDVLFINAQFGNSRISFKSTHFGQGSVDFHYSRFGKGNLTFDKARFGGGEVSFKRVDFGVGKIDFKRANFGDGLIDFSESEFKGSKVIFRSSIFGQGKIMFDQIASTSDFVFDNAEFGSGGLSFFQATANSLSFQLCQLNNHVDLRVTKVSLIDLRYTIVRDIIDLMPNEKCKVEIDEMNFSGMRNLGQLYIDWRLNGVRQLILSQKETTLRQKSEQFLVLKETYNTTGRYADEDKAYIWYKRMELKSDLEYALQQKKSNGIWAYPTAFFKWLLFDKIGLYATEPLRVLFSVSVVYTLFSLIYLIMPLVADTYIDTGGGEVLANLNEVAKAFYYSAITFLTIGYGEYYPVGILRVFASLEGYVGVFLMGYFSVAFVRKVLR
jgi:hypothetical protein